MTQKFLKNLRNNDQSDVVKNWLASWGFTDNPFGLWEAGREPWLKFYFIKRAFYEQLLNNPKSTLIFAPRGGGKSATRIMIETECRPTLTTASILAVPFTDFSTFTESAIYPVQITLRDYLPLLISAVIHKAILALMANQDAIINLNSSQIGTLRFWTDQYMNHIFTRQGLRDMFLEIEPELEIEYLEMIILDIQQNNEASSRKIKMRHRAAINFFINLSHAHPIIPAISMNSPSQVMRFFIQFVLELLSQGPTPCHVVYLLIDGVDEYAITQNNPEISSKILLPLLGNLQFLEIPGLVLKFFLPAEQQAALREVTRTDRIDVIFLTWDTPTNDAIDDLRRLLRRRIATFNKRGIQTLDELCDPSLRRWLEDAMLDEAHDSPRSLMRLGNLLFAEHCRSITAPESVILPIEWEQALEKFHSIILFQPGVIQEPLSYDEITQTSVSSETEMIRVNFQTGDVFRGVELLPPLPDLEYRLLAFLYRQKGRICSKDEVALAVYEPKYKSVDISDQAIARLINRLRQHIETNPKQPYYIITIKGRGYRLDHAE